MGRLLGRRAITSLKKSEIGSFVLPSKSVMLGFSTWHIRMAILAHMFQTRLVPEIMFHGVFAGPFSVYTGFLGSVVGLGSSEDAFS
jgi:hypothetical protein